MSQRQGTINHCDVCGHEWLPSDGVAYTHCTSGKCRSRKWNMAAGDSKRVNLGSQPEPAPTFPTVTEMVHKAIATTPRKDSHDPKTCRIYRCGMCAVIK